MGKHYVIVASLISGARFISEDISDLSHLQDIYDRYTAMVQYFGGGSVVCYEESPVTNWLDGLDKQC